MFLGKYIQAAGNQSHEIGWAEIGAPKKRPEVETGTLSKRTNELLVTYFSKAAVPILKGRSSSSVLGSQKVL